VNFKTIASRSIFKGVNFLKRIKEAFRKSDGYMNEFDEVESEFDKIIK
jgi:hypothetical protein